MATLFLKYFLKRSFINERVGGLFIPNVFENTLCSGVSRFCGASDVNIGSCWILLYTIPIEITQAEVVHGGNRELFRNRGEPCLKIIHVAIINLLPQLKGFFYGLFHAITLCITVGEIVKRLNITLFSRFTRPLDGLLIRLFDAIADNFNLNTCGEKINN